MAESLISIVLEQLASITVEQGAQAFELVTGVEEEIENLESNLEAIQAVLEDAEERQLKDKAVNKWLDKLRDVSYDIDDVLDEWNTAILKRQIEKDESRVTDVPLPKKVWSFALSSCFCARQVVLKHDTALKIQKLNKRLDIIANGRSRYSFTTGRKRPVERNITTFFSDEKVFGREEDEKTIKNMLLCESSEETSNLRIISIVGMVGLGKTTLSRLAYNDAEVISHFGKRIWVCVSDPFDEERISVEILESLGGKKPDLVGKNNIQEEISKHVPGMKILLVLDDVWTEDSSKWEQLKGSLKNSSPGSRILVTTRKLEVGIAVGSRSTDIFSLETLSEDKCWSLFSHLAFSERREECEKLEDIGRKIVERCKGLPLAVKTLGGLLRFKKTKEQWQSILDSKMWEIEEVEKGVFPPLLLSYYDLSPVLRQCFSLCAIFPKDYKIAKDKLIKLWMAQGFVKEIGNKGMGIIGEEYFNTLAMRSFFQDFEKSGRNGGEIYCKMHDIVHDFAQLLTSKECLLVEFDVVEKLWKNTSKTNRHSFLILEVEGATFPIPMDNWKKLRTLFIDSDRIVDIDCKENLLDSVIDNLTCLRALDFSVGSFCTSISRLSDEIGKLIHLRYLNLSNNHNLFTLPKAICDLYNLQILDISWCHRLTELPCGIGKLINLVYLENEGTWSLRFIPKEMERLTRLRTLKEFVVSHKVDSRSLQGLGKLTHLQGDLKIRGLGNVAEASVAMEARLLAKTGLRKLTLEFDGNNSHPENEAFVVEALQPPPNLETLSIWKLGGSTLFPNWMMSLKMLKSVALNSCANWESLPPMGKLPSLEYLTIHKMGKVKKVGEEFLGIEREDLGQTSSSVTNNNNVAFTNLKTQAFSELENWEEWEYDQKIWGGQEECSCITIDIMPRLQSLKIIYCRKLKSLPHQLLQNTPTIQELHIERCPILEEHLEEGRREEDSPFITIMKDLPHYILSEEEEGYF
ncbi:hypothetical protein PTKIN_Ptkin14bG0222600 [Pterospermum kingtungense]